MCDKLCHKKSCHSKVWMIPLDTMASLIRLYKVYVSFTLYVTIFLNKTSLSKSFCLLTSGLYKYDASKFFLALAVFVSIEKINHVKQWPILFQRCLNGSELLDELLYSFCLTSALHLVIPV